MNIDWNKVPKAFNFVAKDANGRVYAYPNKPRCDVNVQVWKAVEKFSHFEFLHICQDPTDDWEKSLIERPSGEE